MNDCLSARSIAAAALAAIGLTMLVAAEAAAQQSADLRAAARDLLGTIAAPTPAEVREPKAVLGRALFWDTRLSANGRIACASCHAAGQWGADARRFSLDARGDRTSRHAQTVLNAQAAAAGLRWVGDRSTGAEQAMGSITGSMGFAERDEIIPVLIEHGYEASFREAFPGEADPVSPQNYARALQAYQETLRTPAALDRWLEGDDDAMSEVQVRGLRRFISVGCAGCHQGPLLGGESLQRFGVVEDYWEHTGSRAIDAGLMQVTGDDEDRHVFRVQPLRNVAETAPYFHDGSVAELERAIAIMARVQLGRTLTRAEVAELVAFQEALTGDVPANYAPPSGRASRRRLD